MFIFHYVIDAIGNLILLTGFISENVAFPKPLSDKEEQYYLRKLKDGDLEAKSILIERNLRLVAHIVKKYSYQQGKFYKYFSLLVQTTALTLLL